MDYPRCATCKYWDIGEQAQDRLGSYTRYAIPRDEHSIPDGFNVCLRVSDPCSDLPEQATATTGNWWSGLFSTAPDFGCVLHEPRQPHDAREGA